MSVSIETIGDKKIEGRLKRFLKTPQQYKGYDVGFMGGNRYPPKKEKSKKGKSKKTPLVSEVAFWNEFGKGNIPARPFFQLGNQNVKTILIRLLSNMLNKRDNYELDYKDLSKLGQMHEAEIKKSITDLREPPNSPETIKRKEANKRLNDSEFGNNPLIETGLMRKSVISKVIK